jgi:CHAT domain-containing protein
MKAAEALSRALLAPAKGALPARRIVLVPDGAVRYVPFAALPAPVTDGRPGARLIDDLEIVTLPSAATLVALRRSREAAPAPGRRLLVLADPVFAADDSRVRARARVPAADARAGAATLTASQQPETAALIRAAADAGLARFERLHFSRIEAGAIAALAPADQNLIALDFKASRPWLLANDLSPYRVVHFATHGLLDSRRPGLSGLVLSLVDEQGHPQDGFLRLNDIFGLRLNAELVVMSACQTALGKDIRGEGIIGLSRGFLHAGAPRVMASFWSVEDRATAELMKRFYGGYLRDRATPAAALRAAQASMARDSRWRAPYYWAAFTLEGEWR